MGERSARPQLTVRDKTTSSAPGERDFEAVVEGLHEGVIVVGTDGSLKYVNPAALRIYNISSEHAAVDLVKKASTAPCYDVEGTRIPPAMHPAALSFRTELSFSKEIYGMDLPSGERRWLLISGCLLNPDDSDSDLLVSFSDITAEREDLDRLVYQANHDPLTGLPNRAYILRRITEALASNDRGQLRAVLFIDLDDLKTTNDTLGHEAGDDLLNAAAKRLRQAVGFADVVGRLGGDEFVVLIFDDATRANLDILSGGLRCALAEPVAIAGTTIPIRASVGVVEVEQDDVRSAEAILRDADRAMYEVKRAVRGYRKV